MSKEVAKKGLYQQKLVTSQLGSGPVYLTLFSILRLLSPPKVCSQSLLSKSAPKVCAQSLLSKSALKVCSQSLRICCLLAFVLSSIVGRTLPLMRRNHRANKSMLPWMSTCWKISTSPSVPASTATEQVAETSSVIELLADNGRTRCASCAILIAAGGYGVAAI